MFGTFNRLNTVCQLGLSSHSPRHAAKCPRCPQLLQDSKQQGLQELPRIQGCRFPPEAPLTPNILANECNESWQVSYKDLLQNHRSIMVYQIWVTVELQPTSVQATKRRRSAKRVSGDGRDCSVAVARVPTGAMGARVAASLSRSQQCQSLEDW